MHDQSRRVGGVLWDSVQRIRDILLYTRTRDKRYHLRGAYKVAEWQILWVHVCQASCCGQIHVLLLQVHSMCDGELHQDHAC